MAQAVRIGEFFYMYRQVFRQMGRGVLWLPLLVYALLATGLALIHYYIFSPVTGPLLHTWIDFVEPRAAQGFFQYPGHFLLFPVVFDVAARLLGLLGEAFFFAVFIDLLITLYHGNRPSLAASIGRAARNYLKLTIVWAVLLVLIYLVSTYFYDFLEQVLGFSLHTAPRRQVMAFVLLVLINGLLYVPFIFILPSIMTGEMSWIAAIRRGFRIVSRHPFVVLGLVMLPYLFSVIPGLPLSYTRTLVDVFSPELVFYLVLVVIGVNLITNFLMIGTAVKFFMDHRSE